METTPSIANSALGLTDVREHDHRHVHELLVHFSTVMLSTFEQREGDERPGFRARPMRVARLDADCTLWFVTDVDTFSRNQATRSEIVQITAQSTLRFLALTGSLDVILDREPLRALWTRADDVWFPDGPSDPSACLLRFTPDRAEFWDVSGSRGLRYWFRAVQALVEGEKPVDDAGLHDEVSLART